MISSKSNEKLKGVKKLMHSSRERWNRHQFVAEGVRVVSDILTYYPKYVKALFVSASKADYFDGDCHKEVVEDSLLNAVSQLKNNSGALAVVEMPTYDSLDMTNFRNIVILDQVSNPENFGAIIRNAVAFQMDCIVYTEGSCDPFHPQSVRASAGYCLNIPILKCSTGLLSQIMSAEFDIYMLDIHAKKSIHDTIINKSNVFIFGSEGKGIITNGIKTLEKQANLVKIPMAYPVDSLNLSVSSGIVFNLVFNSRKKSE